VPNVEQKDLEHDVQLPLAGEEFTITVTPTFDEEGFMIIDGSEGEGGGQILRMSLALSGILQKPIRIINIRAQRANTGLGQQHVSVLSLLQNFYSATVSDFQIGTNEISFQPGPFTSSKKFLCHSGTASSITLMIQAALPCLLFAPRKSSVEFQGGTHVSKSPHLEYLTNAIQPFLERFGATFYLDIKKKGYLASGGGQVDLSVTPVRNLRAYSVIERGNIESISLFGFHAGTVPAEVPQRMVHDACKRFEPLLTSHPNNAFEKEKILCSLIRENKAQGSASGLNVTVTTDTGGMFCASMVGGKGVNAEKVSKSSVSTVLRNLKKGGAIDEFLQDQIIIYCALATGKSSIRCGPLSRHTMSVINLVRMMTGANITICKTKMEDRIFDEEKSYIIHTQGIGLINTAPNV